MERNTLSTVLQVLGTLPETSLSSAGFLAILEV